MQSASNLTPAQIEAAIERAHVLRSEALRDFFKETFATKRSTDTARPKVREPFTAVKA